MSFEKFWPLVQELSELFAQPDFWCGLFFVVLLQLLRLKTHRPFCFVCTGTADLERQRCSDSWGWPFCRTGVKRAWFCPGRGACYCRAVDAGSVFCSVTLWAAAGLCIKLLMCCAVDCCLDLISNLWLFLKACSRDCTPTHTAPVTPSISWVSKYRTEKIH